MKVIPRMYPEVNTVFAQGPMVSEAPKNMEKKGIMS